MSNPRYFPRVSSPIQTIPPPFQIVPSGSGYYVANGACFSTFSYDTGTFLPIKNLNTYFELKPDQKVFIEIDVLPNLQPSGAKITWDTVGANSKSWKTYPTMFEVQPNDEMDKDGKVIKLIDNKCQTKCFILIGYKADDANKNGPTPIDSSKKNTIGTTPVQILNTDFVLLASVVSGVPMIFPSPFFNGTKHINAIQAGQKL
jgi:hypothetical protein